MTTALWFYAVSVLFDTTGNFYGRSFYISYANAAYAVIVLLALDVYSY